MGGDGGVIASNRRYMRGAGTADHTGDAAHQNNKQQTDPAVWREEASRMLKHCYISQQAFSPESAIVACPYGRLYLKEVALEALLKRKQQQQQQQQADKLGTHVRGLKDLRPVRFHFDDSSSNQTPTCPITGRALNGQVPCYVVWPGNENQSNVVSENGFQMLIDALQEEYGPVKEKWRLVPPPSALEQIQQEWDEKIAAKKNKKKRDNNKRKRQDSIIVNESSLGLDHDHDDDHHKPDSSRSSKKAVHSKRSSVSEMARARVSAAVQKSQVLSSLFTTGDRKLSEKEKKDRLFAQT